MVEAGPESVEYQGGSSDPEGTGLEVFLLLIESGIIWGGGFGGETGENRSTEGPFKPLRESPFFASSPPFPLVLGTEKQF